MSKLKWFKVDFVFSNDRFSDDECFELAEKVADLIKDTKSKEYCGSVRQLKNDFKLISSPKGE